MATYHTNSKEYPPEHREVHHNNQQCPEGKRSSPNTASPARAASRSVKGADAALRRIGTALRYPAVRRGG